MSGNCCKARLRRVNQRIGVDQQRPISKFDGKSSEGGESFAVIGSGRLWIGITVVAEPLPHADDAANRIARVADEDESVEA